MRRIATQAGFTLVEIMVVVIILGVLAALVVPKIMSRPDQARVIAARSDIKGIETALNLYRLDNGQYPGTLDQLAQASPKSGEPYLDKVPQDPWGNDYVYRREGRNFAIKSLGADGVDGGEGYDADIDNRQTF
jgi:general secretion pathway protein G